MRYREKERRETTGFKRLRMREVEDFLIQQKQVKRDEGTNCERITEYRTEEKKKTDIK